MSRTSAVPMLLAKAGVPREGAGKGAGKYDVAA